jgi:hypothetical protein
LGLDGNVLKATALNKSGSPVDLLIDPSRGNVLQALTREKRIAAHRPRSVINFEDLRSLSTSKTFRPTGPGGSDWRDNASVMGL